MKMMKTKFSIKTGVIVLIGLFFIFIFVYNLGKRLEGYEDKDNKEQDKKEDKKEDKNVKEAAEGADSTTNADASTSGGSATTGDSSKIDKETLKFIVDKMLK